MVLEGLVEGSGSVFSSVLTEQRTKGAGGPGLEEVQSPTGSTQNDHRRLFEEVLVQIQELLVRASDLDLRPPSALEPEPGHEPEPGPG